MPAPVSGGVTCGLAVAGRRRFQGRRAIRRQMWRPTRRPLRWLAVAADGSGSGRRRGTSLTKTTRVGGLSGPNRSLGAKRREAANPRARCLLRSDCWTIAGVGLALVATSRPSHLSSNHGSKRVPTGNFRRGGALGTCAGRGSHTAQPPRQADPDPLQEPRRPHTVTYNPPTGRSGGVDTESVSGRHTGCECRRSRCAEGREVGSKPGGEPCCEWSPRHCQRQRRSAAPPAGPHSAIVQSAQPKRAIPAESAWSRPGGRVLPAGGGRYHRPTGAAVGSRAAAGRSEGPRSVLEAAAGRRGMWPGGRDNGRSAAGCRGPAAAPEARPFPSGELSRRSRTA